MVEVREIATTAIVMKRQVTMTAAVVTVTTMKSRQMETGHQRVRNKQIRVLVRSQKRALDKVDGKEGILKLLAFAPRCSNCARNSVRWTRIEHLNSAKLFVHSLRKFIIKTALLFYFCYCYSLFILSYLYIYGRRTTDYWIAQAAERWREANAAASQEPLSEKELKKEGFLLAELRFGELAPVLSRLNELEEQQASEEREEPVGSNSNSSARGTPTNNRSGGQRQRY